MFIKCFQNAKHWIGLEYYYYYQRSLSRQDLDILIITAVVHFPCGLWGEKNNKLHPSSRLIYQLFLLYVTDPQENLNLGNDLFSSILFWHLVITTDFVHLSFPEEKALNATWMIIGFAGTQIWCYSFGR